MHRCFFLFEKVLEIKLKFFFNEKGRTIETEGMIKAQNYSTIIGKPRQSCIWNMLFVL
jgi:hypothetical protein